MTHDVTKSPQARRDLIQIADHIAQDHLDAAIRFLDAAEAACEFLAQTPEAGTLCQFRDPEAAGIRVWSIRGFQNFLIFYRPVPEGADIVRVLHGAQDIESLFSE